MERSALRAWLPSSQIRLQLSKPLVHRLVVAAAIGGALALGGWLLAYGPALLPHEWALYFPSDEAKALLDLNDSSRVPYAQIAGGMLAGLGAVLAWRNLSPARRRQSANRLKDAVRLLTSERDDGSPNVEARVRAIYALERHAQEVPGDHRTVVPTLAGYVRKNAPWRGEGAAPASSGGEFPRADIQAALTVLGRRNRASEEGSHPDLDLWETDLRGAQLADVHLERARLTDAHLEGANLMNAHLEEASLIGAHLRRANLIGAHLEGTTLMDAHLEGARLMDAHLEGARLIDAHLEGASLIDAHLEKANLIGANVEGARLIGAYLDRACLVDARLEGARLTDAHLGGARLTGAPVDGPGPTGVPPAGDTTNARDETPQPRVPPGNPTSAVRQGSPRVPQSP